MTTASSSGTRSGLLVVATFVMVALPASQAAPSGPRQFYRINDTGLTRCTRDFMTLTTDCAGTGQDIETGRDVTKPVDRDGHAGFSFVKVCNSGEPAGSGTCSPEPTPGSGPDDWGCVHDRVTGLEWEIKTNDGSERDRNRHFANVGDGAPGDTSAYVFDMNANALCGHADWRVPTTYELQGLLDFDRSGGVPAVDPHWIPNTLADWYWAAEGYFGQERKKTWVVLFKNDYHQGMLYRKRTNRSLVRLVRADAGQSATAPRPLQSASGDQVTDRGAHVVWRRCVEGMTWTGTTCQGREKGYVFSQAILRAQDEAARTGLPWRLPNIKELHTIVDETALAPAIDQETFPVTPKNLHWSSTASTYDPSLIWTVSFVDGRAAPIPNDSIFYLRLVRDE